MSLQKHIAWLHAQLPRWVDEQIISSAQAEQLQLQYPLKHHNVGRLVFSAIGATVFGLGVILFFAYNWEQMHRFLKIGIIFSGIILSHLAAQWFAQPQAFAQGVSPDLASARSANSSPVKKNASASEGLALLGTVLFGAGIWLISQIYHIDEHYPNAFAAWGVGALLMAWAMQSRLQAFAAALLIIIWGVLESLNFSGATLATSLVIAIGIVPLAWRLKSPILLLISTSSLFLFITLDTENWLDEAVLFFAFALAAVYICSGALLSSCRSAADTGLRYVLTLPGFLVYLGLIFMLTFIYDEQGKALVTPYTTGAEQIFFWLNLFVSLGLSLLVVFSKQWMPLSNFGATRDTDRYHAAVIALAALLFFFGVSGLVVIDLVVISILANLLFVAHCILLIISGSRDQRGWEVGVGCLAFSILVFARYTDLFDSLLSRSLVFLLLGAGLFWVGNFYWRQREQ